MKRTKKGFTIVELVIVIGVIAILSAILIPTFANLTSKAEEARAITEVTDVYTAYLIDAGSAAKKQDEVVIVRDSKNYTYTQANGWKENGASGLLTDKTVVYENGNHNNTLEEGEIGVYADVE